MFQSSGDYCIRKLQVVRLERIPMDMVRKWQLQRKKTGTIVPHVVSLLWPGHCAGRTATIRLDCALSVSSNFGHAWLFCCFTGKGGTGAQFPQNSTYECMVLGRLPPAWSFKSSWEIYASVRCQVHGKHGFSQGFPKSPCFPELCARGAGFKAKMGCYQCFFPGFLLPPFRLQSYFSAEFQQTWIFWKHMGLPMQGHVFACIHPPNSWKTWE